MQNTNSSIGWNKQERGNDRFTKHHESATKISLREDSTHMAIDAFHTADRINLSRLRNLDPQNVQNNDELKKLSSSIFINLNSPFESDVNSALRLILNNLSADLTKILIKQDIISTILNILSTSSSFDTLSHTITAVSNLCLFHLSYLSRNQSNLFLTSLLLNTLHD